jgi:fatty acid desaturase
MITTGHPFAAAPADAAGQHAWKDIVARYQRLTVPLVILAAGFLVRACIIFHDRGHGSFFKSRRANDAWGVLTGVLTFTPYYLWRWEHAVHHAGSGDLDRRGTGDVWTLTVQEYLEASRWKRFAYRLWDEQRRRLVGYRHLHQLRPEQKHNPCP